MTATFDFTGKVVLITGSSSGIGAHAAQEFSRAGAQIVITGRNQSKLNDVALQCMKMSPTKLQPLEIVLDMGHEDVSILVDKIIEAFGKLDVLVNSAGKFEQTLLSSEQFEANFDSVMHLNLKSCLLLSRAAAPYLKASKGCIVNVSSMAGTMPGIGLIAHSSAKAGLNIASKVLAKELKGVRVNCITPSIIHTPMVDSLGDEASVAALLDATCRATPIGRGGVPQDTSDAILFLASSRASFLTGVILPVTGGSDLPGLGGDVLEGH
ncbi:3-oxoacyl-[acyl-carrier-protein] reductase FabG [Halotydeus destructor]|nr:3-oxoacyl-[acyl-carrier-protein] reductase FabG [Halotydeus destructor]